MVFCTVMLRLEENRRLVLLTGLGWVAIVPNRFYVGVKNKQAAVKDQ